MPIILSVHSISTQKNHAMSIKQHILCSLLRTLFVLGFVCVFGSSIAYAQHAGSREGKNSHHPKPKVPIQPEMMRWRVLPRKVEEKVRENAASTTDCLQPVARKRQTVTRSHAASSTVAASHVEFATEETLATAPYVAESLIAQPHTVGEQTLISTHRSPTHACASGVCMKCVRRNSLSRLVGRAEYLLWWTSGLDAPPLATTSPNGTAQDQAGVLGLVGTSVLFGENEYNGGSRSGGRYTIGFWNDNCNSCGWEFNYLHLGDATTSFSASNANTGILARPFFNETTNAQDARLIAFPGVVDGSLGIDLKSKFQSAEAIYRWTAQRSKCGRMEYLLGYRFAELDDGITIAESTLSLAGPTAGTSFDLLDQFDSKNTFHGGQFGIACQWQPNRCWSIDLIGKLALGATQRQADVTGRTLVSAVGNIENPAGLLTQGSNIGSYRSDNFTTITEFGLTLNRHFNRSLTANFGYTFLYWNDVARAGDQIDLSVNTSQIPPGTLVGAARPAFAFRSTDFWAQGMRFGLELRF